MVPEQARDGMKRTAAATVLTPSSPVRPKSGLRALATAASLVAMASLQGCSSVPDWANPVQWYDSAVSAVVGEDTVPPPEPSQTAGAGEAAGKAPELSSVPDRPVVSSARERRAVREGLTADRSGAQYTDQNLQAGPAAAPEPAVTAAAPQAAPAQSSAYPAQSSAYPAQSSAYPATSTAPVSPAYGGAAASPGTPMTVEQVYQAQLRASAATVTTAPANAGFAAPRARPVPQFATAVPAIVQQTYNASLGARPVSLPTRGTATANGVRRPTTFNAAGSELGGTIPFRVGSTYLGKTDREVIRQLVQEYRARGGILRVIGYAAPRDAGDVSPDERPLREFDVAHGRAAAVARELARLGAKSRDIFVEAHGAPAAGPYGDEGDMRVAQIFLEN